MGRGRTLALCGMDRAEEAALRSMVEAAASRLGGRWSIASEADADVLLIDVDSMYGQMSWLKAQGGKRPIVALTAAHRADADYLLARPPQIDALARLLAQLAEHAGGGATEAAEAPVATEAPSEPPAASAPAPQPAAPSNPAERKLLDFLRDGVLPGPVRLHGSEPPLAIDPIGKTYLAPATLKPLLPLATRNLRAEQWDAITSAEYARLRAELGEPQPLSRLIWLAGLGAGDGELLAELAAASRFKLNKYPQAEREFPKHVRIALGMLKAASTLDELAAASGATRAEVADYVNACHALGLVEAEGLPTAPATAPEPAKAGLLGRLRGKR